MHTRDSKKKESPTSTSSARAPHSNEPDVTLQTRHQTTAPLGSLSPANALEYQRLFGNQFVLQQMRQNAETALQRDNDILQRNDESAKLLEKLAIPQVKPGPQIEAQKNLVKALDSSPDFSGGILNLGGILFEGIPAKDDDLAKHAQYMVFPTAGGFISAGAPRSQKLKDAKLEGLLMQNIVATMVDAQQIEYLRLAGLPNAEWKILVEVHYYRERDMTQTGMHKDTLGETLFVNLNYHMDREVVSPEVVVNPDPSPEHDALIKDTLPPEFLADLKKTRAALPEPTAILSGTANPYDYVAFVDEAIHHATPFYNHRYVTGADFKGYLKEKYPDKFSAAEKSYTNYTGRSWFYRNYDFASYVKSYDTKKTIPESEVARWEVLMELVSDDTRRITRNDLKGSIADTEFDLIIDWTGAKGGTRTGGTTAGFHSASIPKNTGVHPVKPTGRPPLKRQMSDPNFRKKLPPQPPEKEKRAFFRTWVRVIPAAKATDLKSKQK